MKNLSLFVTIALVFSACSSTPTKTASSDRVPEYDFPVSIEMLKRLSILHAETLFQEDLKNHRLNAEEVSLRDYAFRYEGRTHPPLAFEVTRPWMAEREFGKRDMDKTVEGPVDVVVDSPKRFVLFYRNIAYVGQKISENESSLKVFDTEPFEKSVEEVKTKDSNLKDSLFFNSLILDLDKTLADGTRNRYAEWEILRNVDPKNAETLGQLIGIEG